MTKEAFADLVLDSTDSLYRVAKGILKNDSDCEDAVWEAVSIGFAKLPDLRQDCYGKTWLIRILIHECYRVLRQRKRFVPMEEGWQDTARQRRNSPCGGKGGNCRKDWCDGGQESEFYESVWADTQQQEYSSLYEALFQIEEKYRIPLILFYKEGYSIREIADILKSTENTVKSWLSRGRQKLRKNSEEMGEGWREQEEEYDLASWISQDGNGHVSMSFDSQFYENTESKKAETLPEPVSEEEGIKICREFLEEIGMEGSVYQAPYSEGSTYLIQPKLEGLPLAEASQWFAFGTFTLEGEKIAAAMLPLKLKTEKKEQTDLLPMKEILERLGQYVELGEISCIEKDTVIREIRLEYYVLLTVEGLVYRPVWNFRGPASWGEEEPETEAPEDLIYMDAVTGAYISSLGSLQGHA